MLFVSVGHISIKIKTNRPFDRNAYNLTLILQHKKMYPMNRLHTANR